ncbi:MAG: hypothetical protein Q9226_002970 [Calogaya cf. arnoldii]
MDRNESRAYDQSRRDDYYRPACDSPPRGRSRLQDHTYTREVYREHYSGRYDGGETRRLTHSPFERLSTSRRGNEDEVGPRIIGASHSNVRDALPSAFRDQVRDSWSTYAKAEAESTTIRSQAQTEAAKAPGRRAVAPTVHESPRAGGLRNDAPAASQAFPEAGPHGYAEPDRVLPISQQPVAVDTLEKEEDKNRTLTIDELIALGRAGKLRLPTPTEVLGPTRRHNMASSVMTDSIDAQ